MFTKTVVIIYKNVNLINLNVVSLCFSNKSSLFKSFCLHDIHYEKHNFFVKICICYQARNL